LTKGDDGALGTNDLQVFPIQAGTIHLSSMLAGRLHP
jgi:hypothetical protein